MHISLAFKTTLFSILVPGTVTLLFPYLLISGAHSAVPYLALVIPAGICILLGLGIYLRCAWEFAVQGLGTPAPLDPPKRLVVTGLYCWTRNPMYQGVLLVLIAECLLFWNRGLLGYAALIAAMFQSFVVFYEEPRLLSQFGEVYQEYCRHVPRWGFATRPFTV